MGGWVGGWVGRRVGGVALIESTDGFDLLLIVDHGNRRLMLFPNMFQPFSGSPSL